MTNIAPSVKKDQPVQAQVKSNESSSKKEQSNDSSDENQIGIENHKNAAKHHVEAAKHHLEAAKHHEDGNHDKAATSTIIAQGHHNLANEAQKKDLKSHALKS